MAQVAGITWVSCGEPLTARRVGLCKPGLCARSQIARQMMSRPSNLTKLHYQSRRIDRQQTHHRVNRLFKTFIFGIILGALGAGALMYFAPAVNLHRERSLISVQPNGGSMERFQINLPRDRILVGLAGVEDSIPAGLDWPGEDFLGDMQAEAFIVRNENNAVVGVASRVASSTEETGAFIEWVVHFPARGTMYVQMELTPAEDGVRDGVLRAGTQDFLPLTGRIREQFVSEVDDGDVQGRIVLEATLAGPLGDEE